MSFYEIVTIGMLVQFFVLTYEGTIYLLNDNLITQDWTVTFNIGTSGVFINMFYKFLHFNFKDDDKKWSWKTLFAYLYPILLIVLATIIYAEYKVDMISGIYLINCSLCPCSCLMCIF